MFIQNLSRVVSYQGDQRPRERREEWRTDNQKTRSNFFSDQDSLVTLSHWNYCTAESIFAQYIFGPVSTAGHLEAMYIFTQPTLGPARWRLSENLHSKSPPFLTKVVWPSRLVLQKKAFGSGLYTPLRGAYWYCNFFFGQSVIFETP